MKNIFSILLFLIVSVFFISCGDKPANVAPNKNTSTSPKPNAPLPISSFEVVRKYKHDGDAFTEGLFFYNGFLYESTGLDGKSDLRKVDIESGKVVQKVDLPKTSFGEGISMVNGKIYQLTWREGVCRVFDAETFKQIKEFKYPGDGWGMTTDGKNLIMTDSTHVIRFIDPETFETVKTLPVFRENGAPLMQINELEWIKGELWANIWHSEEPEILGKPNYIVRIDPNNGKILGWVNLDGISPDDVKADPENTLNGIAYDEKNDRIFVTGKKWKNLYEIKLK
ncbi:MAG: glutaminyl-peptide cyclotransferase [Pyrinomonadaceae bacterium]|nr:glutaminyl-peptide cyclotransferase [Pyrinomonadaceae bacterium]